MDSSIESSIEIDTIVNEKMSSLDDDFDDQKIEDIIEDDNEMMMDWVRPEAPFGEILIRAQLILSDPEAEEAARRAKEAKKADNSKNPLDKLNKFIELAQEIQDYLFFLNNQLEQIRNLFNWTHPNKTKFVMMLLVFLLVLFLIIPSRYILLFLGLFFFTERFRPLGTMVIKFKHLIALIPTNDDLAKLYSEGPLLGSSSINEIGATNDLQYTDEDSTNKEETVKLSGNKFYAGVRDKYLNLGLRNHFVGKFNRELQNKNLIISESDIKAMGHLRYLKSDRNKLWRRAYFVVANHQLMYWGDKDHLLVQIPLGAFGELTKVSSVAKGSKGAAFLATKGITEPSTLDCAFVIHHPEKYSVRQIDEDERDNSKSKMDSILPKTYKNTEINTSKTLEVYFIANSVTKAEYWKQNIKSHCVTQYKVNKLI